MTTYNTYQEAKIANPKESIFKMEDGSIRTQSWINANNFGSQTFLCMNPSDHCMTLGELRSKHGGEQEGDLILGYSSGSVKVIKNIDAETRSFDCDCLVLRAAALENQMNIDNLATQTPEEKEALDTIKPVHLRDYQKNATPQQYESIASKEVEWVNGLPPVGVECEYAFSGGGYSDWFECEILYVGKQCVFIKTKDENLIKSFGCEELSVEICNTKFRKPETQQQREERERLEAAYDLYVTHENYIDNPVCSLSIFSESNEPKNKWLSIVDKTNYRKESNQ